MIQNDTVMGIRTVIIMAYGRIWIDMEVSIAMTEAAETMIKTIIPGQALAEEHLVVGKVEMMTTKEAGTAMKTDITDVMIILGMIRGVMIGVLPKTQTESKASKHS